MAYVSMSMSYVEWANRERAHAIEEVFSAPIQTNKDIARVVLRALAARVETVFFIVLATGAVLITIIPDLVFFNIRLIREHGVFSRAGLRANLVYHVAIARGLATLATAIIAPEIVYLRMRALDTIHHDIARVLVSIPRNLGTLCDCLHLDGPLARASLGDIPAWRAELADTVCNPLLIEHDFKIDPAKSPDFSNFHFEIFREPFRRMLERHYSRGAIEGALPHRYDFFGVIADNLLHRVPQEQSAASRRILDQLTQWRTHGGRSPLFANPATRMQKFRELIEALLEVFPELQRNITELDNEFHTVMYRAMQEVRADAETQFRREEIAEMGPSVLTFFCRLAIWKLVQHSHLNPVTRELEFESDFGSCMLSETHDIPGLFSGFREIHAAIATLTPDKRALVLRAVETGLLQRELDVSSADNALARPILHAVLDFTSPSGIIFRKILCDPIPPSFITIFQ